VICYDGWGIEEGALVIQSSNRTLARMALIGALIAVLGLAGCGRKSGLDLPPSAAVSDPGPAGDPQHASAIGPDGKPVAPKTGPKTPTILDWLVE
jgi:predicted small lipoprotein YifL